MFKIVTQINKKNLIILIIFGLLFISINFLYLNSLLNEEISVDSSYFLCLTEKINEGYVLYKDLNTLYTPMFFLIVSKIKYFFDIEKNYTANLVIIYIFQIINFVLVFFLSRKYHLNKILSLFSALIFLIFSLAISRLEFKLEYCVNTFGLLSLIILNKNSLLKVTISGVLMAICFLTKQYGLGYFGLGFVYLLLQKGSFKNYIFYVIGFIVPLFIFNILYPEFLDLFINIEYSNDPNKNKGWVSFILDNFKQFIFAFLHLLRVFPIIFFSFLIHLISRNKDKYSWLLLIGIIGFLLQFFIAPLYYYYFLVIPFVSIYVFFQ